jgi:aryl-alcohol dehydrogenase-like predicted oxidoreductase
MWWTPCAECFAMDNRRLALGTAQFGTRYGIANVTGQISTVEMAAILERACAAGIDTLDTAIEYGDSEQRLGDLGVAGWRIITKLPPVPDECHSVGDWVERSLTGSLRRLRLDRVYGLLLHRPSELLGPRGEQLYAALGGLKDAGLAGKIGVSVYSPAELEPLLSRFHFDLVQAPFNIVDRRLTESGWLSRLHAAGTEVHTRSLFLQGLLLMDAAQRPAEFARWRGLWDRWHEWLATEKLSALQAALSFGFSCNEIRRFVIGVDSLRHFEQILAAGDSYRGDFPRHLECADPALVDPSEWKEHEAL